MKRAMMKMMKYQHLQCWYYYWRLVLGSYSRLESVYEADHFRHQVLFGYHKKDQTRRGS